MVSTRKKKNQQKTVWSTGVLNNFVIENSNNKSAIRKETLEHQANGRYNYAEGSIMVKTTQVKTKSSRTNLTTKREKRLTMCYDCRQSHAQLDFDMNG